MVDDILGIQRCSSKSLQLNSTINTFINLEKLTLSSKKCHNIHIGTDNGNCPNLTIHGNKMENTKQETYLGDLIDKSGSCRPNIEKRRGRGYGITTNILAIVDEVPLAHWKVQAGLSLRQAMLLNGILFNSEAWHGVDKKDIVLLEKVDEALIRGILEAHPKIPLEALFLETKSIPIRFIVASRRIMYLHTILQRDESEMIRRIYETQKMQPSPGDFIELVKEDCATIGLDMSDNEIAKIQKQRFKSIVKSKVINAAFIYLQKLQQSHSKMDKLKYSKFEHSPYLSSPLFNNESRSLLLALRTRTVRGIRSDFGGIYPDKMCPLGCGDLDNLKNILTCKVLQQSYTSSDTTNSDIKYEDIFSNDVGKQKQVTELYRRLLEIRNKIISSQPVANTGPVHCVQALQKPSVLSS